MDCLTGDISIMSFRTFQFMEILSDQYMRSHNSKLMQMLKYTGVVLISTVY